MSQHDPISRAAIELTRDLSPTALVGERASRPGVSKTRLAALVAALDAAFPGEVDRARIRPGTLKRPTGGAA